MMSILFVKSTGVQESAQHPCCLLWIIFALVYCHVCAAFRLFVVLVSEHGARPNEIKKKQLMTNSLQTNN